MFAEKIISFLKGLELAKVPRGIQVLNPYRDSKTLHICTQFFAKYYSDDEERTLLLGINPGRFGSGTTGISFTDPIELERSCGIANDFPKVPELSSDFIYRMINAYGGAPSFYQTHFISAVSPLGFTKDGKNINYYDDRALEKVVTPFIIKSMQSLLALPIERSRCLCIGEGQNFKFLQKLNEEQKWFGDIVPLAHPRFVMQYKRKQLPAYIDAYLKALRK